MSTSAMHVARTGLDAQQYKMQVIANNLANVNTTGFKRDRANFETLFYQIQKNAGAQTGDNSALTSPLAVGTGVKVVSTQKLFTQGGLVSTDNALDLAIDGEGFFQALLPDGRVGYTRSGILSRNADGLLTTPSGYVVQPQITIPDDATSINISNSGVVSVTTPGNEIAQEVGQLSLARFSNPRGLIPIGENFLVASDASGDAQEGAPLDGGYGKLMQGYIESSNVNVVQQLVDMIETQRAYEVSSKSITAVDEMMQFISRNL
jgi:flagellar basal-body rod protein FlgG